MSYIRRLAVMTAAVIVMIVSVSAAAVRDGRPMEGAGLPCSASTYGAAGTPASVRDNRGWVTTPLDRAPVDLAPLDLALRPR